jgi:AraC-like DNA-binding protein
MSDNARPRPYRSNNIPLPSSEIADATLVCPRHVRRALAYLRRHFTEKVMLADLAAAAGTSERTLRRNFPRFVGLAPLAYLQQLRLTAVRNELSRGKDTISLVAARHGFTHFGRFAIAYRECFGETPLATCRRARQGSEYLATGRERGALPCHCRFRRRWLRTRDESIRRQSWRAIGRVAQRSTACVRQAGADQTGAVCTRSEDNQVRSYSACGTGG